MYSYPQLLSLLELHYTVEEFLNIINTHFRQTILTPESLDHESILQRHLPPLPLYCYAICPLCHIRHDDTINTYTLNGWLNFDLNKYPFHDNPLPHTHQKRCSHYLGVQTFIHLHGVPLTSRLLISVSKDFSEVPYMIPWIVTEPDITSAAVIHALPICQIKDTTFTPTYTVFMISYFLQDRITVWERHWQREQPKEFDAEWYPWKTDYTRTNPQHPHPHDLQGWATMGVLGYLDYTDSRLPLRIGRGLHLPTIYQAIEGKKHPIPQ